MIKTNGEAQLREIYRVIARVPRGCVITYGQVAELAGIPRGHRVAARAMRTCPPKLPWYRVMGKKNPRRAKISIADPESAALQRKLLKKEGIAVDDQGCVSLRDFGWLPLG
jgi:methylated-DNA-protein-cysteine methyltransferase-like protein